MTITPSEAPVVETTYGPVRGSTEGSVSSWKGIRYAAPPVGPLRFRAPVPPKPWTEVRTQQNSGRVSRKVDSR